MSISQINHAISSYLRYTPISLVIRETCRIYAIKEVFANYPAGSKILDVGCGDGNWWKILQKDFNFDIQGIDINSSEVEKAQKIIKANVIDITKTNELSSLGNNYDVVIGNCSLEHIPDINQALKNIFSLMKTGATFILFVPTPYWALKGESVKFLHKLSPRLSMMFSGMINGFFQHWHLYHHVLWRHLLSNNGFTVTEIKGLGSSRLEFLYRLYLPSAFISFIVKIISGKYLNHYLAPMIPQTYFTKISDELAPLVSASVTYADDDDAFEYMIFAKKGSA